MSANSLVQKIATDTEARVAEINTAGASEVVKVEEDTKKALEQLQKERRATLEKLKAHIEVVDISRAKQAGNIDLQNVKRGLIDSIFDDVLESFKTQPTGEYVAFFTKKCSELIPEKIVLTKVYTPKNRFSEAEKILTSLDVKAKIIEDNKILAGLVMHTEDGVYDITLDRLFEEKRASLEMEVVNQVLL